MVDIKVIDGWYVIQGHKLLLVLTKQEFIHCLRRGRWWQRQQGLQARLAAAADREEETPHGTHHQTRRT
jgi:hypothetical protein